MYACVCDDDSWVACCDCWISYSLNVFEISYIPALEIGNENPFIRLNIFRVCLDPKRNKFRFLVKTSLWKLLVEYVITNTEGYNWTGWIATVKSVCVCVWQNLFYLLTALQRQHRMNAVINVHKTQIHSQILNLVHVQPTHLNVHQYPNENIHTVQCISYIPSI